MRYYVDINTNFLFVAQFSGQASRITQKSQGRRRKNSQLCLFTGEEQSRRECITPTLIGHHPHLTHPHTPLLQDSTIVHGDVLDSIPINSTPIKQHTREEQFSHGDLHHHRDGIGRRMDGFETPRILHEQDSDSSPLLEENIPDSVGYPTYSQWDINQAVVDQSQELTVFQRSNHHGQLPSSPTSNTVASMMGTFLGPINPLHSDILPNGGNVLKAGGAREAMNIDVHEDESEEEDLFTRHQSGIQQRRNIS